MIVSHNLGFPRIGIKRETKWALEAYWQEKIDKHELLIRGKKIRHDNWKIQNEAGIDILPVGDFSWYDHVLDMSFMLGVIPERFKSLERSLTNLTTYFLMARGEAPSRKDRPPCAMTKWFDTNYHYIVPELNVNQEFCIANNELFNQISEGQKLGYKLKPVLIGPLTFLWLSKNKTNFDDKLTLLNDLLIVYKLILQQFTKFNIEWVQIDEPILALDLPLQWRLAFQKTYEFLSQANTKILLTTYFGELDDNIETVINLPVAGLHLDLTRGKNNFNNLLSRYSEKKILSLGLIDGRNIWKTDLNKTFDFLKPIKQQRGDSLWLAPSCSLLHVPVDLDLEIEMDKEIVNWLAFAKQKLVEVNLLTEALNKGRESIQSELDDNQAAILSRTHSKRIHHQEVKSRAANLSNDMFKRQNPFSVRKKIQDRILNLPLLPITTIGSFPQTSEIRSLRQDFKNGLLSQIKYNEKLKKIIDDVIKKQEALNIDILVHGEFERNDMVEYFAESLEGFTFTKNGWVQSYGSRCVKPPIIFGDIKRAQTMTVPWISYAQQLTSKPVKGMLTGPNTMLAWSFVRDDQPRFETAKQLAFILRDELKDLENAGIKIIQVDEPAFREGMPLRKKDWPIYLKSAIACFKLTTSGVNDSTQIHTHMCYSEFNDIISEIAELDADVISIETSRSNMQLLKSFENFNYPNEIGPGIYDVHSPRIPLVEEIVELVDQAITYISPSRLWINPDCGLKTRTWEEVITSLKNVVKATHLLRIKYNTLKRAS